MKNTKNIAGSALAPLTGSERRREVSLGAMEPPLTEQLKGLAPKDKLELLERFAKGITLLYIHGILTDRESDAARRRLMGRVKRTVEGSPNDDSATPVA